MLDRVLGSKEERASLEMLSLLRKRLIIDLRPDIYECYALGPYSVFNGDERESSRFGDAVRRAKYGNDQGAVMALSKALKEFVRRHPRLKSVAAVTAPPRSASAAPNIPVKWAYAVAEAVGANVVEARWKVQPTGAQKNREGSIANNMSVVGTVHGSALILDDTIGSGATLCELGRALREAGARRVYGLCVAKDARFTHGGVDLSKERWQ
ncbi:MAG: phosphoribosyltransferase [Chloroflexi bacterium]|nr:phosphoribosyltransferase [Chloroflexota bacterium]MYB83312.1 phosphoribosyltransferase [Chloroflexota bacterium]